MNPDKKIWSAYSTATISDALDRLGIIGQLPGIFPLTPSFKAIGRAFTVGMIPVSDEQGTVGDYIDDVPGNGIVVIDNDGRTDVTVWGDILTTVACKRGLAGTVINGVCRDVARILEINYPVFSKGRYMRTGKDRIQVHSFNKPVCIGECMIYPGDLLIGDADGVVVVPKERESDVLEVVHRIGSAEDAILGAVESGLRLDDARKKFNYHELQRKDIS